MNIDLSNRETEDLMTEIKYFTGANTCHLCDKDLTLFKANKLGESIPVLAWELVQRGRLDRICVLLEQSSEQSHKWICNQVGYGFCN